MKQKTPFAWAHLKDTLRRLQSTAKKRTVDRKRLKDRLRYQDGVIDKHQARIKELEEVTTPQPVFNCVYPAQMMALAVFIVLNGGSLRCAAATVGFYSQELMGWKYKAPTWKTISNWVERCGLHAHNLTQGLSGQFVGIIDVTVQIGKEQLCLLLGVPADRLATLGRPLTIADVVILGMEVQSTWKADDVAAFIRRRLKEMPGVEITYVVCDQGSNLLAALKDLGLPCVNDCGHVMMNLVKKIFAHDAGLSKLCAEVGTLRQKLNLTDDAFVLPPTLRDKDRFLRIFTLVEWMDRIDGYWPNLPKATQAKLKFYKNRWRTLRLRQVQELLVLTAKVLKYGGLCCHSRDKWLNEVVAWTSRQRQITAQAKQFLRGMEAYFISYAPIYIKGRVLLCCSDIIESIFGRYKNKGGMKAISADVLSIALYNQTISPGFVQLAMKSVTGPMVDDWRCTYVCHNRYGIRRRMEKELKNAVA